MSLPQHDLRLSGSRARAGGPAGNHLEGRRGRPAAGWLEALDRTPGALGIMYTTWQDKYSLLGPFGDLVRKR